MLIPLTNDSGDTSIVPKRDYDLFKITVGGVASTRNFLVQSVAPDGPKTVDILIIFDDPTVVGIVVNIQNSVPTVAPTLVITSDGVQPNALARVYMDGTGILEPVSLLFPAFD